MRRGITAPHKKRSLKERRRRAQGYKVGAAALLGAVVFGGIIYGLNRPEVTIVSVEVRETEYVREELVHRVVTDMLQGTYLLLFPRNNIFLFPQSDIERELKKLFLSVESVVVERNGLTGIQVFVTERVPDTLWCTKAEGAGCFLMDEDGFVFSSADETSGGLMRFEGGGLTRPLGETYLPGVFADLRTFIESLREVTGRTPTSVNVDENQDIYVVFNEGGELRLTLHDTNDALLENIASVFASKRFSSGDAFEYADFRFGNKVYVVWKE